MILSSPAFAAGASIPRRHTCDGEDLSPPLAWQGVPSNASTFALVVDDPDAPAGTWVHWVLFDIPAPQTGLSEGMTSRTLPSGTREGKDGWGRLGWAVPAPPPGRIATTSSCTRSTRRSA